MMMTCCLASVPRGESPGTCSAVLQRFALNWLMTFPLLLVCLSVGFPSAEAQQLSQVLGVDSCPDDSDTKKPNHHLDKTSPKASDGLKHGSGNAQKPGRRGPRAARADPLANAPLHKAVQRRDLPEVRNLLANPFTQVDQSLKNGLTPLMMAVDQGSEELVELFLEAGAEVDKKTPRGTVALHYAAARGRVALMKRLIQAGASVDTAMTKGTTPLTLAAQSGRAEAVKLLLEHKAKADVSLRDGVTPLMLAAQNGHLAVVQALLEAGADPQHADRKGRTALTLARKNEHQLIVALLAAWGPRQTTRGQPTPRQAPE